MSLTSNSRIVGEDIAAMQNTKIFVLGDLILDTYVRGSVNRISPEAPVPVVLEQKQWSVLGGAANVAANIAAFGSSVVLGGRIGRDADGERFLAICRDIGVDVSGVLTSKTCPTTRKLRVMAGYQQLVRIDSESFESLSTTEEQNIIQKFQEFLKDKASKALVISDYGKGVCNAGLLTKLVKLANDASVSVITDPKSMDMSRYAGSDIIKPNLSEGRDMLKVQHPGKRFETFDDEIDAVCGAVLLGSKSRHVVLSLSERGVVVQGKDLPKRVQFSSTALQVADVSGAGDTMVAFLAMGMAAGIGVKRSVQLANVAAGIVCSKLGTATVTCSEFIDGFRSLDAETLGNKIYSAADLQKILDQAKTAGKRVVFTNGCFDLLHAGHVDLLQKAKACGDILVVALNTDASVQRLKGPERPLQSEMDRARIMSALGSVDYVTLFDEETPLSLVNLFKPQVLVKGGDYTMDTIVGAKEVISWGGKVETIPLLSGRSTTALVQKSRKKS